MQRKSHFALIVATVTSMLMLSVVPMAAAEGGTSGSGSSSGSGSGSGSSTTETHTSTSTTATTAPETETPTETHSSTETSHQMLTVHQEATKILETERHDHKAMSTEKRKTACEARATEINKRLDNYATNAQKHLDVFIGLLTKVQAFHDSKKLTVTEYDSLLATAKTKQVAAQAAVDTLKALDVKIDCTQPDPAAAVATAKAAVKAARTSLQDFRTAIKNLVVAVKGASTAADTNNETEHTTTTTTTTGGNQ